MQRPNVSAKQMKTPLTFSVDRLLGRIEQLGRIGALEGGGVCRLAFSDADKQGRDLVVSWMRELGLEVRIDQIGNVFGIRQGVEEGPPVMTGSHIDTVATGGLYDGALGVLAGLEVIQTLNEHSIETRYPVAVAFFSNEEGARFAPDMMGSLVFQGDLSLSQALATEGFDGTNLGESLKRIGYDGTWPVGAKALHPRAYVELHVEQGPVLEEEGKIIGVVEGVQGISWSEFTFLGQSNHAGTTPMRLRRDAGYAAATLGAFIRELAQKFGGNQVATMGALNLEPNLINVVPEKAVVTIDLRNTNEDLLQEAERQVSDFAQRIAAREGLTVSKRSLARFAPVHFQTELVEKVEKAAISLGYSHLRLPSGAGHDAQIIARIAPTAMIFVASQQGLSHNVQEYTKPDDLKAGGEVLLKILMDLAQANAKR